MSFSDIDTSDPNETNCALPVETQMFFPGQWETWTEKNMALRHSPPRLQVSHVWKHQTFSTCRMTVIAVLLVPSSFQNCHLSGAETVGVVTSPPLPQPPMI